MNTDEIDRFPGAPHPREADVVIGHADAEHAFLDALKAGRLHHAWILGGPEGIGKATLAWRIARFMLADAAPERRASAAASLDCDITSAGVRRVLAASHTDLFVLRRPLDRDGKRFKTVITVDAVRDATRFFQSTSPDGGWRVCIVDAADDLERAGANALLKLVEEPPPRCLILFVSHAPARLIATIRSRCRRRLLTPLTPDEVGQVVRGLPSPWRDADPADVARAAQASGGSVRGALKLLDPQAQNLTRRVEALLSGLPALDTGALLDLCDEVAGRANEEAYEAVFLVIRDFIHTRTRDLAAQGCSTAQMGILAPLVEVWDTVERARRETEALNLDKRGLVITVFGALSEAFRLSRAA